MILSLKTVLFKSVRKLLPLKGKLIILTYHRVRPNNVPFLLGNVDVNAFEKHVSLIKRLYTPLSLSEASEKLRQGNLPDNAVCITFDDGYADNYNLALPILRKWEVKATFFIATGFLDGGRMWNDTVIEAVRNTLKRNLDLQEIGLSLYPVASVQEKQQAITSILNELKYLPIQERYQKSESLVQSAGQELPNSPMMTSEQVLLMNRAGMEIGAHTVTHPILSNLTSAKAENEIVESRKLLQNITSSEVACFAYPNGKPGIDYYKEHTELVKQAGFKCAVSTTWGCANANSDMYQLPRIGTWDMSDARFNLMMIKTCMRCNTWQD